MRTRFIMMIFAAVLCVNPGCEGEDPLISEEEPPECGSDPSVLITFPDPEVSDKLAHIVDFEWIEGGECDVVATRYLIAPVSDGDSALTALNDDPENCEELWSEWIPYSTEYRGNSVRLEDELVPGYSGGYLNTEDWHLFAVQAKSEDGTVTGEFEDGRNARIFDCETRRDGPTLKLFEDNYLGDLSAFLRFSFYSCLYSRAYMIVPGNSNLELRVEGVADFYGGRIAGYRIGWNVPDPCNWDRPFTKYPDVRQFDFPSGTHALTFEVKDEFDLVSMVTFEFEFVQWTMERDLLWIDDFPSYEAPNPARTMPLESEHDEFWEHLCSKAPGFDPAIDIYDVQANNYEPPPMELLSRYKNIIWTYSSNTQSAFSKMLRPELAANFANMLPYIMAKGGHVWTLGRPSGLKAALEPGKCLPASVEYPPTGGYLVDPMPYRDYGVTAVDAVYGDFCFGDDYPASPRTVLRDAMRIAVLDGSDPVTLAYPGLPDTLRLWDEITDCSYCFFNLRDRGFLYVEVYDPAYWMDWVGVQSQPDFHPMYRLRSMSITSALYDETIAIWITKYQDVVPQVVMGVAVPARSVHMGFPLWFFDREQAGQIADVIFEEWGIAQ
ncbi:MAG: hypothetical protein KOO63_16090 [Bacteroidales bacterium]|nr:hypothetical protein [Candidatus Latescibacterota bacterium]